MVQLCERNLGSRHGIFLEKCKKGAEKVPFGKGCMSSACWEVSKPACFRDPRKQPHSGRSRPRAWEKQAVFTPVTRKGEGKKKKRGNRSKAPNFSGGREGAAGRSCGQVEAEGQGEPAAAADVGRAHAAPAGARDGGERACALGGRRGRPRTRRGRGQSPSPEPAGPQSRHRPRPRSPRLRGRQVLPARATVPPVGRARRPPPGAPARPGTRSGGAYLARPGRPRWAWLRGPGSNWLPGEGPASPTRSWRERKAGCSQPRQRSSAMDAHPEFQRCRGTPIPLPSALFRRRRRRLHLLLRRDPPPTPHTLPSCSGGTAAADTSLPGAGG